MCVELNIKLTPLILNLALHGGEQSASFGGIQPSAPIEQESQWAPELVSRVGRKYQFISPDRNPITNPEL
jgi:hypothetical protein